MEVLKWYYVSVLDCKKKLIIDNKILENLRTKNCSNTYIWYFKHEMLISLLIHTFIHSHIYFVCTNSLVSTEIWLWQMLSWFCFLFLEKHHENTLKEMKLYVVKCQTIPISKYYYNHSLINNESWTIYQDPSRTRTNWLIIGEFFIT